MTATSRVIQKMTDPWIGFFALVLAAWGGLFVFAAGIAGHADAAQLGPGMAWFAPLLHGLGDLMLWHDANAHNSLGLVIAMWLLMCIAMMAPTAVPMIRAYGHFVEGSAGRVSRSGFFALVGGYVVVWAVYAVVAAGAQQAFMTTKFVTHIGVSANPWLSAVLLALAGTYQFSAIKQACLSRCRSPLAFFFSHWRDGVAGGFTMGLRHGAVCVGCCWALMALAFVGGTMNLAWMGGAMVLMIIEKLPVGRHLTTPLGAVLLFAAAMVAARALPL